MKYTTKRTVACLFATIALSNLASAQLMILPNNVRLMTVLGATETAVNSAEGFTVDDLGVTTGFSFLNGISVNIQGSTAILNDGNASIGPNEAFSSNGTLSFDTAPGNVIGPTSFENNTGGAISGAQNAFTVANGTSLSLTNTGSAPNGTYILSFTNIIFFLKTRLVANKASFLCLTQHLKFKGIYNALFLPLFLIEERRIT